MAGERSGDKCQRRDACPWHRAKRTPTIAPAGAWRHLRALAGAASISGAMLVKPEVQIVHKGTEMDRALGLGWRWGMAVLEPSVRVLSCFSLFDRVHRGYLTVPWGATPPAAMLLVTEPRYRCFGACESLRKSAPARLKIVRVLVELFDGDGGEVLLASPLGDLRFKVLVIPYAAHDINYLDVVRCTERPGADVPWLVRQVVQRSGWSTLRILFDPGGTGPEEVHQVIRSLVDLGAHLCDTVGSPVCADGLLVLGIPPDVETSPIYEYLISLEAAGVLASFCPRQRTT